MGIGNTTASSAITVVITGKPVKEVTGRGTGVDDVGFQRKISAIEQAIRHNAVNASDPLEVLAKVGGYEIGGLAGVILGAAAARIPVLIDGFISGAAALIAAEIKPESKIFMIASHCSVERGHRIILDYLELKPLLQLDLRLGEGTGAAIAMKLVDDAVAIRDEMATFADAGVFNKD
jgi:nicotinate-nucleotide--dimethylbenzimidazole phosphoribosyltransferase